MMCISILIIKSSGTLSRANRKSACHLQKIVKQKALSKGCSSISLIWTQNCRDLMQTSLGNSQFLQSSVSIIAIFSRICENMFLPRSKGRINWRKHVSKQRDHKAYRTVTVAVLLSCFPFVPWLCVTYFDYKAAQARTWSFSFFVYA